MKGGTDKIKTSVEATGISDKTTSLAVNSVLELGKKLRKTNVSGTSESEIQAQLKDLFKQHHGSDDDEPAATNPLLNMLGALI